MMTEHDDRDAARDLLGAVTDYLRWQKKLGHPGIPTERLLARRQKAASEAATATATAPARPNTPAPPAVSLPLPPSGERPTLEAVRAHLGDCTRCKLAPTRQNLVFGEGNPDADIMFIGEGPGADEDAQGRPFVGRAGQLLTRWIELGMGIPRSQVYIANIVKCRPPNNRDPEPDEAETCLPFLIQQIRAVRPKVIVLLGRVPMGRLLGVKDGITKVHGTLYEFEGIPAMPIFHPSYCLRPPLDEKRRLVWEDLKKLLTHLGLPVPSKK